MAAYSVAAEREGFEPSIQFPVCRLSKAVPSASRPPLPNEDFPSSSRITLFDCQPSAEEEGFEPPGLSSSGFQDRRLKPLGHSSNPKTDGLFSNIKSCCKADCAQPPASVTMV